MSSTTYSHSSHCCLHINASVTIIFLLFYRQFHSLHPYLPNVTCTMAFLDSVSQWQHTSTLTILYVFPVNTNVYGRGAYMTIPCVLPLRALRAAGQPRQEPRTSFEVCERWNERFKCEWRPCRRGVRSDGQCRCRLTCRYRAVSGVVVEPVHVLPALRTEVKWTWKGTEHPVRTLTCSSCTNVCSVPAVVELHHSPWICSRSHKCISDSLTLWAEVCNEASPVICFRNFSFFLISLGNMTVERRDGRDVLAVNI